MRHPSTHAVTSLDDGSIFSYDDNGNMTTRYDGPTQTTWTYTFDAENRLVAVSDGTTTTTYRYDAGCDAFLTNDLALKRVTDLTILVLDELELPTGDH